LRKEPVTGSLRGKWKKRVKALGVWRGQQLPTTNGPYLGWRGGFRRPDLLRARESEAKECGGGTRPKTSGRETMAQSTREEKTGIRARSMMTVHTGGWGPGRVTDRTADYPKKTGESAGSRRYSSRIKSCWLGRSVRGGDTERLKRRSRKQKGGENNLVKPSLSGGRVGKRLPSEENAGTGKGGKCLNYG